MGISTREVNTAKVRNGLRKKRNSVQTRRVRSFQHHHHHHPPRYYLPTLTPPHRPHQLH